jgi:hypothetical protein
VFGLETCGNAEEINFPNSDNVTSFLAPSVPVFLSVGRIPCVNLDFIVGGEAIWSFKFFESGRVLVFVIAGEGNLWKPPVRTKRRRRKGVVFSLSIAGLATELRRSGDAIIQEACGSLFFAKS